MNKKYYKNLAKKNKNIIRTHNLNSEIECKSKKNYTTKLLDWIKNIKQTYIIFHKTNLHYISINF